MGLHSNVVYNNCLNSNFSGAMYICAECDTFNLCEYCPKNAWVSHISEHTFIKLSFFPPKNQLIKTKEEPFEIMIDIVNTREKNLQDVLFLQLGLGINI